ncbi:hypothetical protein SAMN02745127_01762 [Oceanospirillum multiglobuliferum]|uniref:Uncharacterized protein n=1 Tax=Oceanospirillum multiglobuliferum TaxID=64969 RepID=A0A1T4Q758_9GAMM|nr:hypothetical protein [Oceanospirillum multiglobuliferum]OPX56593.1 hypothetical protein BTE48_04005 [Oceanospirillum multiglobuliferum]SJZ99580.1 hypothetical protein SAMN02745127_01762 [Oceanospirillum multiglobuliferum]
MALTKAQVSLVTVTALGVAPGGYEAQLSAFSTQKELAAFIGSAGLLSTGTNAEFALAIGKNVGLTAGSVVTALFNALENGTSRADAVVDFANGQLVAGNATLTAALAKAEAYTGGSTDLAALQAAIAADVVATPSGLVIEFKDEEKDQHHKEDSDVTSTLNGQNVVNIGKAQIDAGASKVAADFSFKLANQIGAGEKFEGQFLSPILERQAADKSGSKIVLELRNLREAADSATPLKYLPTNGFGFTIDGQLVQITSDAIDAAETYADLLAAIKARIEDLKNGVNLPQGADEALYAKLATFTVELGQTKAAEERDASGNVTKTYDVSKTPRKPSPNRAGIQAGTAQRF